MQSVRQNYTSVYSFDCNGVALSHHCYCVEQPPSVTVEKRQVFNLPHKKRRCKKKNLTAPFITKPLASDRKHTAYFIVILPSTGMSQKLVTFWTAPHPLPHPFRTGDRQGIYTPASAASPSQPLYQAAFERVRDLHSLTT